MKISVDFSQNAGKIKQMHCVNNGPVGNGVRGKGFSNVHLFKEAGIPYARLHDSAFYSAYGGEYSVDVHRIFPNFDADVNDPGSYIFAPTDKYLSDIEASGTKTFYRLGAAIEHGFKRGTFPPKDTIKWCQICEHIIMHYTQGWANGFNFDIEYWEIWDEPDCINADGSNPCWQGTREEFAEFFATSVKYLKEKFPNLKIGGPAMMYIWGPEYNKLIFDTLKEKGVTLDFYSFHKYGNIPNQFIADVKTAYRLLSDYGCNDKTELILNEWNYVRGWLDEKWVHTRYAEKGMKGAAFISGVMAVCQYTKLDKLMYYDARPCGMNGMFDTDFFTPLKGYYPFVMFNNLYKLENAVEASGDTDEIYAVAAKNGNEAGIMVTYFSDNDDATDGEVVLDIKNGAEKYEMYLLDEDHDNELVGEVKACEVLTLKPQSVVYLKSI